MQAGQGEGRASSSGKSSYAFHSKTPSCVTMHDAWHRFPSVAVMRPPATFCSLTLLCWLASLPPCDRLRAATRAGLRSSDTSTFPVSSAPIIPAIQSWRPRSNMTGYRIQAANIAGMPQQRCTQRRRQAQRLPQCEVQEAAAALVGKRQTVAGQTDKDKQPLTVGLAKAQGHPPGSCPVPVHSLTGQPVG